MVDEATSEGQRIHRRKAVREMLERAWRPPGFCVPNPATYPHQWLWDSCFHSLIWSALDDERAIVELEHVVANGDAATGFVPHMTYWNDPSEAESFWGNRLTSTITQPPMFGHAANRLVAAGRRPGDTALAAMGEAFRHLLVARPRTAAGLVPVYHPWETGCDDSARWDDFRSPDVSWWTTKGDLVADLVAGGGVAGGPRPVLERPRTAPFEVGSIGFNALVAWNCRQWLDLAESARSVSAEVIAGLDAQVAELVTRIAARWDGELSTWVDDGPPSGRARTLDGLLALLVDPRPAGFDQLIDPEAHGARFGPCGAHRLDPTFDPGRYWRGPAWPQLTYLLWMAARAAGRADVARPLAAGLVDGADASRLAEYWHPDTGAGLGARPQTWAGLAIVVETA